MDELGTVVVTGGASGLGAAVAAAVERRGGNPVVLDVNPPANGFPFERVDLARTREAESVVDRVAEQHGGVRAVVTAAGIDACGRIEQVNAMLKRDGRSTTPPGFFVFGHTHLVEYGFVPAPAGDFARQSQGMRMVFASRPESVVNAGDMPRHMPPFD